MRIFYCCAGKIMEKPTFFTVNIGIGFVENADSRNLFS